MWFNIQKGKLQDVRQTSSIDARHLQTGERRDQDEGDKSHQAASGYLNTKETFLLVFQRAVGGGAIPNIFQERQQKKVTKKR